MICKLVWLNYHLSLEVFPKKKIAADKHDAVIFYFLRTLQTFRLINKSFYSIKHPPDSRQILFRKKDGKCKFKFKYRYNKIQNLDSEYDNKTNEHQLLLESFFNDGRKKLLTVIKITKKLALMKLQEI